MHVTLGELTQVADSVKALPLPDSENLAPIHSDLVEMADDLDALVERIERGLASSSPNLGVLGQAAKHWKSAGALFNGVRLELLAFCSVPEPGA